MKQFKLALSVILVLASMVLCQQVISHSQHNQKNKRDYAELNHIRYGLLSIDTWKNQISTILKSEIDKLDLSGSNEKELKRNIEAQLHVLIEKINTRVQKSNKGSAKGWIKQKFIDTFVSLEEIKKGIPEYADAMVREMKQPSSKERIKKLIWEKLDYYLGQTFDNQDMSQIKRILAETQMPDIESAKLKLQRDILRRNALISTESIVMIALAVLLFLIPAFDKKALEPLQYSLLVLSLLILLLTGVTTPMIDMEAKIAQMSFMLFEHPVRFENQVLYFQTKSILDVFWVMMADKTVQMKFVGLLMITFSIFFPVLKILSSLAYYYNYRKAQENKWIQFFVLKSGKWSMADVMVVAIFMAYIGFNGIITGQFGKMNTTTEELVILTTNGTSLQPGYYLFLTYALLALFLSGFLTRISPERK